MTKLVAKLRARLGKPSVLATGLAVLAGGLAYLNLQTFGFGEPWSTLVTAGLAAISGLGISPLAGAALQNTLHIDYKTALGISSAISTAAVGLTTVAMDSTVRAVLVALLTAVAGMLVGPRAQVVPVAVSVPVPVPVPVPAPETVPIPEAVPVPEPAAKLRAKPRPKPKPRTKSKPRAKK